MAHGEVPLAGELLSPAPAPAALGYDPPVQALRPPTHPASTAGV